MPGIENKIEFANGFKLQPSDATSIANMKEAASDVAFVNFVGNPNGSVSANAGSLCFDYTTGAIYRKASGTGNTGWVSIAANNVNVTTPGAYPYTTLATDYVILVDTSSARTINPMGSPATGQMYVIKDSVGSAAANNITITPTGKNIDGAASSTINLNYGSVTIVYNGTEWSII